MDGINNLLEAAPHPLLRTRDPTAVVEGESELNIRIFHDQSVMGIFCDDRTSLTTRIYPDSYRLYGVQLFAESFDDGVSESVAKFRGSIWDGLTESVEHQ